MKLDGPRFHFEAVLEAPIWLLVVVFSIVTAAVIVSALAAL